MIAERKQAALAAIGEARQRLSTLSPSAAADLIHCCNAERPDRWRAERLLLESKLLVAHAICALDLALLAVDYSIRVESEVERVRQEAKQTFDAEVASQYRIQMGEGHQESSYLCLVVYAYVGRARIEQAERLIQTAAQLVGA